MEKNDKLITTDDVKKMMDTQFKFSLIINCLLLVVIVYLLFVIASNNY